MSFRLTKSLLLVALLLLIIGCETRNSSQLIHYETIQAFQNDPEGNRLPLTPGSEIKLILGMPLRQAISEYDWTDQLVKNMGLTEGDIDDFTLDYIGMVFEEANPTWFRGNLQKIWITGPKLWLEEFQFEQVDVLVEDVKYITIYKSRVILDCYFLYLREDCQAGS